MMTQASKPTPAIFLDRDGVICENRPDYVKSWAEFRFLPGVREGLALLNRLGLPIVVVSNQSAVNRGLTTVAAVDDIHRRMLDAVRAAEGRIDRVFYCPHRPDEACSCRKPRPGMLLQAARELNLDLSRSYLVGDAATDLLAGHSVGCQTMLVLTGRGFHQLWPTIHVVPGRFTIVRSLLDAARYIRKLEGGVARQTILTPPSVIGYVDGL
ncbi:MAG: HAD family hydrolase [Caldilineae bacterium]|nr:MAG: HAD family hydrolase [Caldilineae bacterium]